MADMKPASSPESTGTSTSDLDPVKLIQDHQAGVWRYLRSLGCEANQAEDLTQETFLAVLEKPFEVYNDAATAAYLRRVAHNLFMSACRREGKIIHLEDFESFEGTWVRWAGHDQGESLLDILRECLAGLTERAQLALRLRFRDKTRRSTIADRLDITEHGAKNLMQRAKQQLRECIEEKLK